MRGVALLLVLVVGAFLMFAPVSSTPRCNSWLEFSRRSDEGEGLARPAVQLEGDRVEVLLAVR